MIQILQKEKGLKSTFEEKYNELRAENQILRWKIESKILEFQTKEKTLNEESKMNYSIDSLSKNYSLILNNFIEFPLMSSFTKEVKTNAFGKLDECSQSSIDKNYLVNYFYLFVKKGKNISVSKLF